MGDNLKIRVMRKSLADMLNSFSLPIEVKRMVLDDILKEVNQIAEQQIQKEIEEQKTAEESKESEDEE